MSAVGSTYGNFSSHKTSDLIFIINLNSEGMYMFR